MATDLRGLRVAILVADGFEQKELTEPRKALDDAGATTVIVSPVDGKVQGWNHYDKADSFEVDMLLGEAKAENFDALLLPGGVANADQLRTEEKAIQLIKDIFDAGKSIAAICHGPWTLIEAGVVHGREMTSWPSLKTGLTNAGAKWVDQEVVTDNGLVTSRKPEDISAFNKKMIEEFAEGTHSRERSARM